MLCFKGYCRAIRVGNAFFALHLTVEEVANIHLHTRLGCEHVHHNSGLWRINRCCHLAHVTLGVEHEIVVIAMTVFQLLVVGIDVLAYGLSLLATECILKS